MGRLTRSTKAWLKRIIADPGRRRGGFEARVTRARRHGQATAFDPISAIDLLGIESTGRWNVPLREVGVRPFPFPYFAGFALANENTYADAGIFEDVHGFVSGRRPTQFGDGLGLEVGDSYAVGPDGSPRLTLGETNPGAEARLAQLAQHGWLDTLYCPGAARRVALAEALERWPPERRPGVFLGSTSPSEKRALARADVRYFADDDLIEVDKFGDHHDHKIVERFRLAARDYDWRRWIESAPDAKPMVQAKSFARLMNETIQVDDRGGGAHRRFKRYCGPWLASMPTFSAQVTSVLLDGLISHAGAVIVQQQLGRWSLIGAAGDRSQARANAAPVLDRHALAAWREIAERKAAGKLWVVTTARLLDHLWRRQALRFTVEQTARAWTIRLAPFRCPVLGERPLDARDLNGLSFTVPEAAPEIIVMASDSSAPLEMKRAADPAHRLRDAVYRAWTYLEWPERQIGPDP